MLVAPRSPIYRWICSNNSLSVPPGLPLRSLQVAPFSTINLSLSILTALLSICGVVFSGILSPAWTPHPTLPVCHPATAALNSILSAGSLATVSSNSLL